MPINRRTFFASLVGLAAARSVAARPAASSFGEDLDAVIQSTRAAIDAMDRTLTRPRPVMQLDDLSRYINQLSAEWHARLNARHGNRDA